MIPETNAAARVATFTPRTAARRFSAACGSPSGCGCSARASSRRSCGASPSSRRSPPRCRRPHASVRTSRSRLSACRKKSNAWNTRAADAAREDTVVTPAVSASPAREGVAATLAVRPAEDRSPSAGRRSGSAPLGRAHRRHAWARS